jgi:hypothetical protein
MLQITMCSTCDGRYTSQKLPNLYNVTKTARHRRRMVNWVLWLQIERETQSTNVESQVKIDGYSRTTMKGAVNGAMIIHV